MTAVAAAAARVFPTPDQLAGLSWALDGYVLGPDVGQRLLQHLRDATLAPDGTVGANTVTLLPLDAPEIAVLFARLLDALDVADSYDAFDPSDDDAAEAREARAIVGALRREARYRLAAPAAAILTDAELAALTAAPYGQRGAGIDLYDRFLATIRHYQARSVRSEEAADVAE